MPRAKTDIELVLTVGNTAPIEISFFMPDGKPEDFIAVDRASFEIRKSTASPAYFTRSTMAGNLTVDASKSRLIATMTIAEADGWRAGSYIGQAAIRRGSDSTWDRTVPFSVFILPGFAPKS